MLPTRMVILPIDNAAHALAVESLLKITASPELISFVAGDDSPAVAQTVLEKFGITREKMARIFLSDSQTPLLVAGYPMGKIDGQKQYVIEADSKNSGLINAMIMNPQTPAEVLLHLKINSQQGYIFLWQFGCVRAAAIFPEAYRAMLQDPNHFEKITQPDGGVSKEIFNKYLDPAGGIFTSLLSDTERTFDTMTVQDKLNLIDAAQSDDYAHLSDQEKMAIFTFFSTDPSPIVSGRAAARFSTITGTASPLAPGRPSASSASILGALPSIIVAGTVFSVWMLVHLIVRAFDRIPSMGVIAGRVKHLVQSRPRTLFSRQPVLHVVETPAGSAMAVVSENRRGKEIVAQLPTMDSVIISFDRPVWGARTVEHLLVVTEAGRSILVPIKILRRGKTVWLFVDVRAAGVNQASAVLKERCVAGIVRMSYGVPGVHGSAALRKAVNGSSDIETVSMQARPPGMLIVTENGIFDGATRISAELERTVICRIAAKNDIPSTVAKYDLLSTDDQLGRVWQDYPSALSRKENNAREQIKKLVIEIKAERTSDEIDMRLGAARGAGKDVLLSFGPDASIDQITGTLTALRARYHDISITGSIDFSRLKNGKVRAYLKRLAATECSAGGPGLCIDGAGLAQDDIIKIAQAIEVEREEISANDILLGAVQKQSVQYSKLTVILPIGIDGSVISRLKNSGVAVIMDVPAAAISSSGVAAGIAGVRVSGLSKDIDPFACAYGIRRITVSLAIVDAFELESMVRAANGALDEKRAMEGAALFTFLQSDAAFEITVQESLKVGDSHMTDLFLQAA